MIRKWRIEQTVTVYGLSESWLLDNKFMTRRGAESFIGLMRGFAALSGRSFTSLGATFRAVDVGGRK